MHIGRPPPFVDPADPDDAARGPSPPGPRGCNHGGMTNEPSEDTTTPTGPPPVEDAPTTEIAAQQATEIDLRPVRPAETAEPAAQERVAGDTAEISIIGADEDEDIAGLRDTGFPLALRGYNTHAVDRYVHRVERCIARFEENRSPTEAVRRALDRVGEQTATVLLEAERSAEETTRKSRTKADDRLQRAEREAAEVWAAAQAKARGLDEDIERLWQERERLIVATRTLAGQLRGAADAAEAEFPPEEEPAATARTPRGPALPGDDVSPSGPTGDLPG